MHNMIIESERDTGFIFREPFEYQGPLGEPQHGVPQEFAQFLVMHQQIHNGEAHEQLHKHLVAHMWARHGGEGDGEEEPEVV